MYGIHVLEHRCTFFLRFSPSVLHANVQLNKTFKSWTAIDGLWCCGFLEKSLHLQLKKSMCTKMIE